MKGNVFRKEQHVNVTANRRQQPAGYFEPALQQQIEKIDAQGRVGYQVHQPEVHTAQPLGKVDAAQRQVQDDSIVRFFVKLTGELPPPPACRPDRRGRARFRPRPGEPVGRALTGQRRSDHLPMPDFIRQSAD